MSDDKDRLEEKEELERYQKIGIVLLVFVLCGFIGWVWEFLMQEVAGGFQHLYIEGGNLLPWVNIYGYGAVLILLIAYRFKKHPWAVFLISGLVCGALEGLAGWGAYAFFDKARYWNYLKPWWGFGSINGFVCPVSAIAFGLAALALVYLMLPWCVRIAQKMSKRAFLTLAISLFVIVMVDESVNLVLKLLDKPTAMNLYESWGWEYRSK